jgi:branched-chain amino acid transport system substrate-binding protein
MEGFYASAPFFVPDFSGEIEDDWVSAWHKNYVADFGEEPAANSVIGYVMADLLTQSLEAAGPDPTVEKMLSGLEGIAHYENPFGGPSMSFSAQKHMAGDYLNLYQVKDRKWTTVAKSLSY